MANFVSVETPSGDRFYINIDRIISSSSSGTGNRESSSVATPASMLRSRPTQSSARRNSAPSDEVVDDREDAQRYAQSATHAARHV